MKAATKDPLVIRDRMIEGYKRGYEGHGIRMSTQQIEQQVAADCQLVDAARASGDLSGPGSAPSKPRQEGPMRPDLLADAQLETSTTLQREAGKPLRFKSLHKNPQKMSERWGAACARVARILQGVQKSSSLVVAIEGAELSALATEYMNVYYDFMFGRHRPPPATGPDPSQFRDLSDKDASRKFMRLVEDICDKSTGKLGSWYVK